MLWASFYLASGLVLRILDSLHWYGPHGWYVNVWILQQVVSAGLLVFVVRDAVRPAFPLVYFSSVAALCVGVMTSQSDRWPASPVETVMSLCGMTTLGMGIIAAIGAGARRTGHASVLAVFLLGYALLSLAGADYLSQPNIGIAWSVLEIVTFAAWLFVFPVALRSRWW